METAATNTNSFFFSRPTAERQKSRVVELGGSRNLLDGGDMCCSRSVKTHVRKYIARQAARPLQTCFWVCGTPHQKRRLCGSGHHYYVISTYKTELSKQSTIYLSSPQPQQSSQCGSFSVSFFIFLRLIFIHLCVIIRLFEICMLSSLLIYTVRG